MKAFKPGQVYKGGTIEADDAEYPISVDNISSCDAQMSWQWNDVFFQFLHPKEKNDFKLNSNNQSCVLQISYEGQTILLPGDIESMVEHQLLDNSELQKPVTVLVAAHHGSKTSSSSSFVKAVRPENVVFSAGYRHHFGHPAKDVVNRYQEQKSRLWNTANSGAIEFRWDVKGNMMTTTARLEGKRYWY